MKLSLPDHWNHFLEAVDKELEEQVCLHCVGGFVVETVYEIPRRTADLDYIAIVPYEAARTLEEIAGQKSELAQKHHLYFQYVTVIEYADGYESRLTELDLALEKLRLFVVDPYDLVLSKLTRNIERDREDVKGIAESQKLSFNVLKKRYEEEMRSYLAKDEKHDLALELWEEYFRP